MAADRIAAGSETRRWRVGTGLIVGLAVATLLLVALDFAYQRHSAFGPERWTGFYAVCGAATCLVCIGGALLLRRIAVRPEDADDR
jgi:hypothetical protein